MEEKITFFIPEGYSSYINSQVANNILSCFEELNLTGKKPTKISAVKYDFSQKSVTLIVLNPVPVKPPKSPCVLAIAWLFVSTISSAQETDRSLSISLFTGAINYQGDLNPNSFTFAHSNFAVGAGIHVPLNRWFTFRAGVQTGKIEAADQWNREYLKPRNLSFTSSIKEVSA